MVRQARDGRGTEQSGALFRPQSRSGGPGARAEGREGGAVSVHGRPARPTEGLLICGGDGADIRYWRHVAAADHTG